MRNTEKYIYAPHPNEEYILIHELADYLENETNYDVARKIFPAGTVVTNVTIVVDKQYISSHTKGYSSTLFTVGGTEYQTYYPHSIGEHSWENEGKIREYWQACDEVSKAQKKEDEAYSLVAKLNKYGV